MLPPASAVTIKSGTYGTDGASTWGLFYSVNGGSSWTQAGSTITTTSTLTLSTFTVTGVTGTARIEIRKLSGGTNRIDIDDITINDVAAPAVVAALYLQAKNSCLMQVTLKMQAAPIGRLMPMAPKVYHFIPVVPL
jgi:hypothetical protein